MKPTLRLKLVGFTFGIVLFVGGTISLYSIYQGQERIVTTFETEARNVTEYLARTLLDDLYSLNVRSLRLQLESARVNRDIMYTILMDGEGAVLTDGTRENALRDQKLTDPFSGAILRSKDWISQREEGAIKIGGPVRMPDGSRIGYLNVGFSLDRVDRIARETTRWSLFLTLLSLGIGAILAFIVSTGLSRPISAITQAAKDIGEGKLEIRVQIERGDELGVLAEAINQMAARLDLAFAAEAASARENARLYEIVRRHAANLEAQVKQRTQELQAANVQLQEALRLAEVASRAKSEFLARMSHELRTPLNAVLGFSEVLLGRGPGDLTPKQERFLQQIHDGGKRLLELLTAILDLTQVEAMKGSLRLEPVPLGPLVQETLDRVAVQVAQKRLQVSTAVEPGLPRVVADCGKLAQVLSHLLGNAVKFTPEGGRITLVARQVLGGGGQEAGGRRQRAECTGQESWLEIRVEDTGIGIAPDSLERIFGAFYQVDGSESRAYGGAGLGLALVRVLVELHGGRVWAESEGEGRGARFIVRLPFLAVQPAPLILVVDDEAQVLEGLCTVLATAGYTVDRARTGAEALERLTAAPPRLLLLDIGLPDMDGWTVLKQVRGGERTRDLPVLVLTGLEFVHANQALALGADEFLSKPVSPRVLVETVARLIARPAAARSASLQHDGY